MEENEHNMIYYDDYDKARALVLLHVLDNIETGGIFYVGDLLFMAYDEGRLLKLKDFTIKSGVFYGWYDYAIELTQECKAYLKQQISEEYEITYLIHYAVFQGERCMMQVFDGDCIDIDKSIHIPEWLLKECERNEVWVSFSDHIDVSRY